MSKLYTKSSLSVPLKSNSQQDTRTYQITFIYLMLRAYKTAMTIYKIAKIRKSRRELDFKHTKSRASTSLICELSITLALPNHLD